MDASCLIRPLRAVRYVIGMSKLLSPNRTRSSSEDRLCLVEQAGIALEPLCGRHRNSGAASLRGQCICLFGRLAELVGIRDQFFVRERGVCLSQVREIRNLRLRAGQVPGQIFVPRQSPAHGAHGGLVSHGRAILYNCPNNPFYSETFHARC